MVMRRLRMATMFNGLLWIPAVPGATFEMLGYIPSFLSVEDERPASKQIDSAYGHGGGWQPFKGFALMEDGNLKYPEDPPTRILFTSNLREEKLFFYEHQWFRIEQPDGTWEVCRLD
jgi:hypothetical protein